MLLRCFFAHFTVFKSVAILEFLLLFATSSLDTKNKLPHSCCQLASLSDNLTTKDEAGQAKSSSHLTNFRLSVKDKDELDSIGNLVEQENPHVCSFK